MHFSEICAMDHASYMQRCLELAAKAASEGESPVGSVIVREGAIIGEGYEKSRQLRDVSRHAEMVAILDALQHTNDLSGSTLYSNVEPCILCSYAIRHHRIAEVIYARAAGELGGTVTPYNVLTMSLPTWGAAPKVVRFS